MTEPAPPGVGQMLAAEPVELAHGGRTWKVGHPDGTARERLEKLAAGAALNEVRRLKGATIGSVESLGAKALTSAYSLGSAAATPEGRTATAAEELAKKVNQVYDSIIKFPDTLAAEVTRVVEAIRGKVTETVRDVGGAAKTAAKIGLSAAVPGGALTVSAAERVDKFVAGKLGYDTLNPFG